MNRIEEIKKELLELNEKYFKNLNGIVIERMDKLEKELEELVSI